MPAGLAAKGDAMTSAAETGDVLSFGPFSLIASQRLLTRNGAPVALGGRSLDILIALVSNPNAVLSKQDLLARKDEILTDRGAWLNLEAVARPDYVSSDLCRVGNEKHRARHADGPGHFARDSYRLGGSDQVTVHLAIDRDDLRKGNNVTFDRSAVDPAPSL